MSQKEFDLQRGHRRGNGVLLIVVFVIGIVLGGLAVKTSYLRSPRVVLSIAGADVSRAGGKSIMIGSTEGRFRQTCNGVCDDVFYRFTSRGPNYTVRVQGLDGACVLCKAPYIDGPWTTSATISGLGWLQLNEKLTTNNVER